MTPTHQTRQHQKLTRARSKLVLDHCFFGCLAMRLALEECNDQPTCRTDGKILQYNTEWIDDLTNAEVLYVLAHEVMHAACGHMERLNTRDPELWNIACDFAVNPILRDAGVGTMPQVGLLRNDLENKSADEIYEILKDEQEKESTTITLADSDPGGCGAVIPPPSTLDPSEVKALTTEWKAALVQAAAAVGPGSVPNTIKRMVKELVDPQVPWQMLLMDFVEHSARNDYNWTRPNRRHLQRGFVLPSLLSDELPDVVLVNDTSGSRSQRDMDIVAAEISSVLSAFDTTLTVIHCDARVAKVETFSKADMPIKLNPSGGGGTDFRPPFKYIAKHGLTPCCLIYFTDLYCNQYPAEPDYPVFWLTNNIKLEVPFGTKVEFRR